MGKAESSAADFDRWVDANLQQLGLTRQERRVVLLLLQGHSNKEIAACRRLHEQTVKDHLKRVYGKLGVHSRGVFIASFYRSCMTSILQNNDKRQSVTSDASPPARRRSATKRLD